MKKLLCLNYFIISFISAYMPFEFSNEPIGNVVLYYISSAPITDATVKPLCAYVDKSGDVKDLLFDGIIVYDVHLHSYPSKPSRNTCEQYINALFHSGHQLDSLNIIVGRIKRKLDIQDFRWKVILTAPYYIELKKDKVTYYCKKIIELWKKKHFSNLELIGFYFGYLEWIDEEVIPVIKKMAEYLHSRKFKFFWIPSYQHSTDICWYNYGFDYVIEQPNYAFYPPPDTSRFLKVNFHIMKYGISGVEIELYNYASTTNGLSLIKNADHYFYFAEKFRWQGNPINVFYFGPIIAEFANIDTLRIIYEQIYNFVRGYECIILQPIEDTYVESLKPIAQKGRAERLLIGTNSYNNCYRTYLKFDLSSIKTQDSINWAKLYLKPEEWLYSNNIDDLQLFVIDDDNWAENKLTWQNQPFLTANQMLDTVTTNLRGFGWHYLDVTQPVAREYYKNKIITLMLKRRNENSEDKMCTTISKEKVSPNTPKLYVGIKRKFSY